VLSGLFTFRFVFLPAFSISGTAKMIHGITISWSFLYPRLRRWGSLASVRFKTREVTGLSTGHSRHFCSLEQLQWGFLKDSIGQAMVELLDQRHQQQRQNTVHQKYLAEQEQEGCFNGG
jgi:hypothetical protein